MRDSLFEKPSQDLSLLDGIKVNMVLLSIQAKNILLNITRKLLFAKSVKQDSKTILIYRIGSFGDTICCLPAIYNIKKNFPQADIDILTNAGAKNLVSIKYLLDVSYYRNIIDYLDRKPKDVLKQIRAGKYDMVIQLPQPQASVKRLIRDMIFFRLAGITNGFGWQKSSSLMLKKTQEKFLPQKSERAILIDLLRRNGLGITNEEIYPLYADNIIDENVYKLIQVKGIDITKPMCGIVIGAKRPQNRWPLQYFREVIAFLRNNGHQVLLLGGNDDKPNADIIMQDGVFNFCGALSPLESGKLFTYCRFIVTNDTGPMHLAYANNVPVVALFSSRDFPGRWFPPKVNGNMVFRNNNISCSLCLSETCANNICMQAIKPGMVIEHLRTLV